MKISLSVLIHPVKFLPKSWRPRYVQAVAWAFYTLRGSKWATELGLYAYCKQMAANGGAELGVKE